MPRNRRRGHGKLEDLVSDHFTYRKTASLGFPASPSAINFEPASQLLAIGTEQGEFRVYGRPGVEFHSRTEDPVPINEIYCFSSMHMFITVSEDNSVVLWEIDSEEQAELVPTKQFKLDSDGGKKITKCCLCQNSGHFYIGTEGGNVFILDIKHFQLKSDIIYWNQSTSLVQPTSKTNPGKVKCMELSPIDQSLILIGYELGVIVLWDLDRGLPSKNYPTSIQDAQQPLESLCWQNEGVKFISSHSDSSLYYWSITNSTPHEGPTKYYDPGDGLCNPVTKVRWLNTDSHPLIICAGGLPVEQDDEHHTVTVVQGADHTALDFSSPVVDFVPIIDPGTMRGKSLLVLCEQELMAFDLETPKCPQIRKPYLYSLHASPVTCLRLYEHCSSLMMEALHEVTLTSPPPHEHFSNMDWPAMGGCVRDCEPESFDVAVSGHENGSVRFWDVTNGSMRIIHELKTANLFVGQEPDADALNEEFSDFKWPPYRKVSSYDPFEDDPRLAVKFIEFCAHSKTLCIGGNGGQVITFSLNPLPSEIRIECVKAEIFLGPELPGERRSGGLRATNALECKGEAIHVPAGFQATFCLQCIPATSITSLAFRPSWGLVAAGISKGFAVGNFLVKSVVLLHPTVQPDGMGARSFSRMQSFRRSIRQSLRRRSTVSSLPNDDRRKIASTLNEDVPKKSRGRSVTEPEQSPAHAGGLQVRPEQAGLVSHLCFAETHAAGGGPQAAVFASTMGSSLIRYTLTLPEPAERLTQINRAIIAGKDYSLLHAAPMVAVFLLDHEGIPLPDPYEVESNSIPMPDMRHPHFAVLVSQEQIKLVSLPGMKQKKKEKLTERTGERASRAWVLRVKVAAAPVGVRRDWNPAIAILTTIGDLFVYSLPDLALVFQEPEFIPATDQKAMLSATMAHSGDTLYLKSFSELQRSLLGSYEYSFHTALLPSLFQFEGSTPLVEPPRRSSSRSRGQVQVQAEVAPEDAPVGGAKGRKSSSPKGEDPPVEKPQAIALSEPISSQSTNGVAVDLVDHGGRAQRSKSKSKTPERASARGSIGRSSKSSSRRRSGDSSSSSGDSSSESDSDSSDDDLPTPKTGEDITFNNPMALGLDDLGGGKELDNIIASSLQQLESARVFYEQMQARVKKSD